MIEKPQKIIESCLAPDPQEFCLKHQIKDKRKMDWNWQQNWWSFHQLGNNFGTRMRCSKLSISFKWKFLLKKHFQAQLQLQLKLQLVWKLKWLSSTFLPPPTHPPKRKNIKAPTLIESKLNCIYIGSVDLYYDLLF